MVQGGVVQSNRDRGSQGLGDVVDAGMDQQEVFGDIGLDLLVERV